MNTLKSYWLSVCVVYTILALTKIITEGIAGYQDPYYILNFGILFIITCFAAFVLFMHRVFHRIPLLFVMIGQYITVIGAVWLSIFIAGKFTEISPNAYCEMFLQITIPYILFAGIYYVSYFNDVKKANRNLNELKKLKDEH